VIFMTDPISTPQMTPGRPSRLPTAKSLFSQHYLQSRLSDHPEWSADPLPVFEAVRSLWERARALGGTWNEAQTEQEFVKSVRVALKREIPVRQRDDWEAWLAAQRAEHEQRTAEIVRLETQLNSRVYDLFDLTPAEVKVIEESTKYRCDALSR
jgi:hypothetical protein